MKRTTMIVAALLAAVGVQAGFVTIGDAGNAADTNGMGAVDYTYKISEHEVTIAEFVASGAGDGDENHWGIEVGTSAPAVNVNFYEAAKYCNWLTSGSVSNGAYSFNYLGTYMGANRASALATYGTVYVVPTTDEWYKAAYYNTVTDSYSKYANGTETAPAGTNANYNHANGDVPWVVGNGIIPEQNGTYDMAGNVWEHVEDDGRIYGGAYASIVEHLQSSYPGLAWGSGVENGSVGFRVVELVADPDSVGWVTIGNPGNAANTNGMGAVDYIYSIGVHEVTIAEFNASGAGDGDEGQWNGSVGSNAPAVMISFDEARKYCNYLTSGNTNNGVYVYIGGGFDHMDRAAAIAAYGTIYAMPTIDEWYKAAYYTGSGYSLYANGTATAPSGFSARYNNTEPWAVGSGLVPEQNGTRDMAANVWEYTDGGTLLLGGAYASGVPHLRSTYTGLGWTGTENGSVGLRVVKIVPDPDSHHPSTIISLSQFSGNVFKMVVACPTPGTSYPKVKTDLVVSGSWNSIGHSTSSGGPFTTNHLGSVAGTNTIYMESNDATAFFGIGEQ